MIEVMLEMIDISTYIEILQIFSHIVRKMNVMNVIVKFNNTDNLRY